MERTLKSLMRTSCILRNWTMLSNYVAAVHPLQIVQKCHYSTTPQDLPNTPVINKVTAMRRTTFASDDLLNILDTLSSEHNLNVHKAIHLLLPVLNHTMNYPKTLLYNHKGFYNLCTMIYSNLNILSLQEILNCLKIMSYFTSYDNRLSNILLQIINRSINDLSLEEIAFMHLLIKRHSTTECTKALDVALPLVFYHKLNFELETDNIKHLSLCLNYVSNTQSTQGMSTILSAIDNFQWPIDISSAISIFKSLSFLNETDMSYRIIKKMQNILIRQVHEIKPQDVIKILNVISYKITDKKYIAIYSELIEAIINNAVVNNIDLITGLNYLSSLNKLDFTNISLLDYLSAKFYEDVCIMKNTAPNSKFILLRGLALADYKPVFWEDIRNEFIESTSCTGYLVTMMRTAVNLAILDSYCDSIIKKIFSAYLWDNPKYADFINSKNAFYIFLIYQSVKTMHPEYTGPFPSESVLKVCKLKQRYLWVESPLKTTLEQALGGSQYVRHQMETKLGHYIDHVVMMKKGGYPVVINPDTENNDDTIKTVEDLVQPPDAQTILIFVLSEKVYLVNTPRVKGNKALMLRTVEAATGFRTIGINQQLWQELPESEKIPYLMQAIMLKCDDLS